ncbi:MAG: response regulator [Spirochaetia bacterium]
MTILLVEDDEIVRQVTALLLEGLGCTVIEAPGGEKALMAYKEIGAKIDCIVTDVNMPGMSGPELFGRVRELNPAARIVFCTGDISEIEKAGLRLGAGVAILQKPYDGRAIIQKIRSLLPDYDPPSSS